MKKVILVLVLAIGGCVSAYASACVQTQFGTGSCSASVDGTTFTVSLVNLTNTSLSNAVNVDVTASSSVSGTDVFSVQVAGSSLLAGNVSTNYGVVVSGNAGAAVTNVSTMFNGKAAGASLDTEVTPTGGSSLGEWNLTSSLMKDASNSQATPTFVSADVNTGLNIPSGLSVAGFTETFTVVWTAAPPTVTHNSGVNTLGDPLVAPEPTSLGLVALAGFAGALLLRRRSSKK